MKASVSVTTGLLDWVKLCRSVTSVIVPGGSFFTPSMAAVVACVKHATRVSRLNRDGRTDKVMNGGMMEAIISVHRCVTPQVWYALLIRTRPP